MEQLNAQAQELSIDMLNYLYCYLIKILLLILIRDINLSILSTRVFLRLFVRGKENRHRRVENHELANACLALLCASSDFDAEKCAETLSSIYTNNIWRRRKAVWEDT